MLDNNFFLILENMKSEAKNKSCALFTIKSRCFLKVFLVKTTEVVQLQENKSHQTRNFAVNIETRWPQGITDNRRTAIKSMYILLIIYAIIGIL